MIKLNDFKIVYFLHHLSDSSLKIIRWGDNFIIE